MNKRLLFLVISLLFLTANSYAQTFPTTFWSAVSNTDWYNDTDQEFTLTTAEELAGFSAIVAAGNNFSGKTALLASDIDLGEHLWTAIGTDNDHQFSGSFDGGGHTISNLFINEPDGDFIGLFGQCTNSAISNVNLNTTHIRAYDTAGSLAGNFSVNSSMTNCHAINVDIEGATFNIGGLVGGLLTNSDMIRCSSEGTVTGSHQIGGLVGSPWDKTNIIECYSAGTVNASYFAGGLTGFSTFAFGANRDNIINNCYSRCDVTAENGAGGGLVGNAQASLFIYNSYSTGTVTGPQEIGGFVGSAGGLTTTNNYWDVETSGHDEAIGAWAGSEPGEFDITGMTTADMKVESMVTLLNQNQETTPWIIEEGVNDGYPILSLSTPVSTLNIELSDVELTVCPTLVNSFVTIETQGQLSSYTLYSVSGKAVQEGSAAGNTAQIDFQQVASGAYILLVNTNQGSVSKKLMKQ